MTRRAIGVGFSVAQFRHASHQVDIQALSQTLARAGIPRLVLAVGRHFIDWGSRALRWRIILGVVATGPTLRLFPVVAIRTVVNNLLPIQIGELNRAYFVSRRENSHVRQLPASVAIERVVDGLSGVGLILLWLYVPPSALGLQRSLVPNIALASRVSTGLGVLVIAAFVLVEDTWVKLAPVFLGHRSGSIQISAIHVFGRFIVGPGTRRRRLAKAFELSILIWLIGAVAYVLATAAVDGADGPMAALARTGVVNLANAIQLAPVSKVPA